MYLCMEKDHLLWYMSATETTMCGTASLNLCSEQFSRRNIFVVFYIENAEFLYAIFGNVFILP